VTDLLDASRDELDGPGPAVTDPTPPARGTEREAAPAGTPLRNGGWRPLIRPTGYYLWSRLLVAGAAVVAAVLFPRLDVVRSFGSAWDGKWYLLIAQHGYPHRLYQEGMGSRWAFFPALPAVIRAVSEVTRLSLPASAVLAAFVFGLTATLAIWLAVRQVLGDVVADRTALLFVFFPLSCMLSFAYTEGLFLTAAAGCLYALGRRCWISAALLACLAGLTRTTGIVVVLCVVVVALPAAWRERRLRPLVAAAVAPLGLAAFMTYSWAMVGTPLAFVTSEKFWQGQHFVWFTEPLRVVVEVLTLRVHGLALLQMALCAAVLVCAYVAVVFLLALTRAARTVPVSWWLYTIGALGLAFSAYYYNSIPRYTLVAFPLLAAVAWKVRSRTRGVLVVSMGSLQAVLTVLFLIAVVHPMTPPVVP
jgi:Mannosyltransferase (PIG-V)